VLVVNDDLDQLRFAVACLEADGFRVLSSHSAEEALQMLDGSGPLDVIVTDLYMPGIDGWRFCQLLRSSEYSAYNAIPVLVVSATFSGADAEEITVALGADAFLAAPYEPVDLRAQVRDLLAGHKPPSSPRVLIVEDSDTQAALLRRAFTAYGYTVFRAVTGEEGRQLFRAHHPELIVLDYLLPDMTGDQLLAEFKQSAISPSVIVITATPTPDLALQLIRQGADNYVRKPFAPDYLLHVCENTRRQRALLRVEEILEQRTRELRDSEKRYRDLFENANDAIVTLTLDGIVTSVNRGLEVMLGWSRAELLGQHYRKFVSPSSVALGEERTRRFLAGERLPSIFEGEQIRKDGSIVPVEVRIRAIRDQNGQPIGFQGIYRDISARKEHERQRTEFLAMLTHDIRNPLGVVLGYLDMLREEPGTPGVPPAEQLLQRMESNMLTIHALITNYLDFSTIEAGRLTLTKQLVRLNELLSQLERRHEGEATRRRITLQFQVPPQLPLIEADPLALERIFTNLIHNALKFTPEAGLITVSATPHANEIAVAITDTGPGIAAEDLPLLFRKYGRVTTPQRQQGTGLGLFIVKELTEAHGGRVEVQSTVGQGSTFTVFLPLGTASH
jgi:PAS domain S-box-containing protein